MVTGKDQILKYLDLNKCPYWRLFNFQGTNLIAQTEESPEQTIEAARAELDAILSVTGGGQYMLEAWESKDQKKGRYKTQFEIPGTHPHSAGIGAISAPSQAVDVRAEIEKALHLERLSNKIETLTAENAAKDARIKELEAEIDSSSARIQKRIEPWLPAIMQGFGFKSEGSAAVTGSGSESATPEEAARLEKAFGKWQDYETDVIVIVEKIANMAATNPSMYQTARGLLMSK